MMINYSVVFKQLRKLFKPVHKSDVKCRNAKAVANRLSAHTAKFNRSSECEIDKLECAQIFQIFKTRFYFNFSVNSVVKILTCYRLSVKILVKPYRCKINILSVPFNAVNACGFNVRENILNAFKFTIVHSDVMRIDSVRAVFPEHITTAKRVFIFTEQNRV